MTRARNSTVPPPRPLSDGASLDLLVVGGGIVGSGVARDAAMRGLKVALIDQHDFAFGTSSRSSRLLHGGLRYLAQGRIGLVREASVEKKILHHIAPHLCRPLPFTFPTYVGSGWPRWQLAIGVKLYDLLCGGSNLGPSGSFSREKTLQDVPGLKTEGLTGSARYFDGLTNDARLVIDTLRSAARHGAEVRNYTKFLKAERNRDGWTCELQDIASQQRFSLQCRTVVNATGPWAQQVPHSSVRLRLSKGVHLVFTRERLSVTDAVVITEGKRILFVLPWSDRVIVGTTDTDYMGRPEDVATEPADIQYVLRTTNEFFPRAALSSQDVISTWAGVRPLIADPSGAPSDISRAHQIHSPEAGWWDVSGGKLTTYRLMAEQTVDYIAAFLAHRAAKSRTALEPLLAPGDEAPYSAIVPPPLSRAAVDHYVRHEWARHLEDVMVRRSGWQHYFPNAAEQAETVAEWMGDFAGWDTERRATEISRYLQSTVLSRRTD